MAQYDVWEKEYRQPKLITKSDEPQLDFKHFIKWLRKNKKVSLEGLRVLDLGSGTGKNSLFLAERGSSVVGVELSKTAVQISQDQAAGLDAVFEQGDIGQKLPFEDNSFDLILDVVSSNSLTEAERKIYLLESHRVLKPGGYMFVKALSKDEDRNALNLLREFPGKETDTYIMPGTNLTERVFSKEDIETTYQNFSILKLENKMSYTKFEGKSYKRHFWLLYLQK